MRSKIWIALKFLLAVFLIFGGIQHFISPESYVLFVPVFLPWTLAIIYVSGLLEILFGLALFFKKWSGIGARGILILMLLFLPIHIWDVFSETPAIGSQTAALIRLPLQFLIIGVAWKVKSNIFKNKEF